MTSKVIERIRDGELQYKIVDGKIEGIRPLTPCERDIANWAKCIKEQVKITCHILPYNGPMWNWGERALYVVTVNNKTGFFRLEEVTVHLQSVKTKNGRTTIDHENGTPDVVMLPDLRPSASANTQNPVASWCHGSPIIPPRGGFTLVNYGGEFPQYDTVVADSRITFKAVPYFEKNCEAEMEIVGT
jgi:hypothetical protein